jgi:uncharacterized protein YcfJ
MVDQKRDIYFKDLFTGIDLKNLEISNQVQVPDTFYQKLLDHFMERSYLNRCSERKFLEVPSNHGAITWLQVMRLPIHPNNQENYDLINRWQGVLSTLHAWGYRLLFLLMRSGGTTNLFIGTTSFNQSVSAKDAIEQIKEAAFGNMPGMELKPLDPKKGETFQKIAEPMVNFNSVGAVTGIPSFRRENDPGMLQTLDQLAFGIRDSYGYEKDYALLVISDPINDQDMTEIISRMRKLGSEIHTGVSRTVNETRSQGESKERGLNVFAGMALGEMVGGLLGSCVGFGGLGAQLGRVIFGAVGADQHKNISMSFSSSVSSQYLDKFAQYAEEVTERHIDRLKQGRNLGYWNVGVYVLGNTPKDIHTVAGMLRSVYSGSETYLEPIRLHMLREDSGAISIVKNKFDLIPLVNEEAKDIENYDYANDEWHIFGKQYQYLSTPMNTKELSLATSLPRRDVPGLRFVKTAVRFANNPAVLTGDTITLGKVVDMGVVQNNDYRIDPNALVRHALVTGSTGSGKSTTCKTIIKEILDRDIPVLIIEPAKDDYVRWAIEMNKELPPEKQFQIFMPGVDEFEGIMFKQLHLNPFEPAAIHGAKVDLLSRCENLSMLINACLPSEEVVPILIDETVYETISRLAGERFEREHINQLDEYPNVDNMIMMASEVIQRKTYAQRTKDNFNEVLLTRFKYLRRGTRGKILNVFKSTDYNELFGRPAVINISRLAGAKDKALIMSLLMLSLYEYRMSAYANDIHYRYEAQKNRLMHLTLVEEAHNVLMEPGASFSGSANPQQAAADLFSNMLSEIREYGQGLLIVDQVPTRLISDVIKNTNYKIAHRMTSPDDYELMASSMALRADQRPIIPSLEIGNAIICGDMDDAAAWVKLNKMK